MFYTMLTPVIQYTRKNVVKLVGFEVLTAIVMDAATFWERASCSSL
jgi:hypothetical protein